MPQTHFRKIIACSRTNCEPCEQKFQNSKPSIKFKTFSYFLGSTLFKVIFVYLFSDKSAPRCSCGRSSSMGERTLLRTCVSSVSAEGAKAVEITVQTPKDR